MKPKILAICSQKGGVGKTTTAINLAHGLAMNGKSVLLIDLDPQGHCATSLGLSTEPGVFYLLTMGTTPHESAFMQQYVRPTGRENLWLLPGDQTTNAAQTVLNAQDAPISAIRTRLKAIQSNDLLYIILDMAPSVGGIQERALWAADFVLIPSSTEYLATEGAHQIAQTLLYLQTKRDWPGTLLVVLPTLYHAHLREHRAAYADLKAGFGERVFPPIHRATVLSECPGEAQTIFEKAPTGRAAQEYQQLVDLILQF